MWCYLYQGCLDAFRKYAVEFAEAQDYETARYVYEDAYQATKRLLQRKDDFTALFAMSDVMAIGATRALQDAGKRVPEDVSVLGLDGLSVGAYMVPRLSTIAQPSEALANRCVDLLLQSIEKKTGEIHELVPVSLQKRESAVQI